MEDKQKKVEKKDEEPRGFHQVDIECMPSTSSGAGLGRKSYSFFRPTYKCTTSSSSSSDEQYKKIGDSPKTTSEDILKIGDIGSRQHNVWEFSKASSGTDSYLEDPDFGDSLVAHESKTSIDDWKDWYFGDETAAPGEFSKASSGTDSYLEDPDFGDSLVSHQSKTSIDEWKDWHFEGLTAAPVLGRTKRLHEESEPVFPLGFETEQEKDEYVKKRRRRLHEERKSSGSSLHSLRGLRIEEEEVDKGSEADKEDEGEDEETKGPEIKRIKKN